MNTLIDPAQHYVEVYEALDTIAEDISSLEQVRSELLEMAETPEDRVTVASEVSRQREYIDTRRKYVFSSVLGTSAVIESDVHIAGFEYINKFESPEGQESAARRVRVYNAIIQAVQYNGQVPEHFSDISLSESAYSTERPLVQSNIKLHGRRDAETGKTWYDLTNPRTVEHIIPAGKELTGDKVVASYAVRELSTDDNGETTVVARGPHSDHPDFTVTFTDESRMWRFNESGDRVELFIPANSSSLAETTVDTLDALIARNSDAAEVAVAAAGANVPNIIESFEYPDHVNPVPVQIAKSN